MTSIDGAAVLTMFDSRDLNGLESWGKAHEFAPNRESTGKPKCGNAAYKHR